jgi:hypothetical protein
MRIGIVAVACALACCAPAKYDPCDEIPHRVYLDTGTAIRAILERAPRPRIYAVGEYHPAKGSKVPSPLARFIGEVIHLLDPRAHHLLLEAWLDDGCSFEGEKIGAQVAAEIGRTPATYKDLGRLLKLARQMEVQTHGLHMTCIEHSAMLDPKGRIDFFRLLETITMKLHERARQLAEEGKAVIVYGGALHNDLYPRYQLESLSYARGLADEVGPVLELDLIVPEVVRSLPLAKREHWYPLLARARPDRVVVWERAKDSYVLILPTTEIVAAN